MLQTKREVVVGIKKKHFHSKIQGISLQAEPELSLITSTKMDMLLYLNLYIQRCIYIDISNIKWIHLCKTCFHHDKFWKCPPFSTKQNWNRCSIIQNVVVYCTWLYIGYHWWNTSEIPVNNSENFIIFLE